MEGGLISSCTSSYPLLGRFILVIKEDFRGGMGLLPFFQRIFSGVHMPYTKSKVLISFVFSDTMRPVIRLIIEPGWCMHLDLDLEDQVQILDQHWRLLGDLGLPLRLIYFTGLL